MTIEETNHDCAASRSTDGFGVCGILFGENGGQPRDKDGCRLPAGHDGPHEFVAECGNQYQWETDWECTCEHCMSGDGDYCSIYWRVTPNVEVRGAARGG